jgi:hypothetical protein
MTIQDWLTITVAALSIIASVGFSVRWVIRHYVKDIVSEFKPNGGSSLKDQVNRLEKKVLENEKTNKQMNKKIDNIYEILINYISKNEKPSGKK